MQDGDRSYVPLYEEAALQLMLGNRDGALHPFDKAIDAGAEIRQRVDLSGLEELVPAPR